MKIKVMLVCCLLMLVVSVGCSDKDSESISGSKSSGSSSSESVSGSKTGSGQESNNRTEPASNPVVADNAATGGEVVADEILPETPAVVASAGDIATGQKVFKKKCKACHSTSSKKVLGPGLAGVSKRHSAAWMKKWIADPQAVWAANDADVAELKKRVGGEGRAKTKMKVRIKDKDINDVVAYILTL